MGNPPATTVALSSIRHCRAAALCGSLAFRAVSSRHWRDGAPAPFGKGGKGFYRSFREGDRRSGGGILHGDLANEKFLGKIIFKCFCPANGACDGRGLSLHATVKMLQTRAPFITNPG